MTSCSAVVVYLMAAVAVAVVGQGHGLQDTVMTLLDSWFTACSTVPGDLSCSTDCQAVVVCTGGEEGLVRVESCPAHALCDTHTLTCLPAREATCLPSTSSPGFRCSTPGLFPHPTDCRRYHDCEWVVPGFRLRDTPARCEDTRVFDALTGTCVSGSPCDEPVPTCESVGQMAALQRSPNVYYVCVMEVEYFAVVPWLYRCPPWQVFHEGKCVRATQLPRAAR